MSVPAEVVERRRDEMLDYAIEQTLSTLLATKSPGGVKEYQTVSPEAKHKLHGIIRYYAKKPHPFRACVRDNLKRFGPGRVEAVCAVVKDLGRGTTYWRGHPERDVPTAEALMSEPELAPLIDDEVLAVIARLEDRDLTRIFVGLDESPLVLETVDA